MVKPPAPPVVVDMRHVCTTHTPGAISLSGHDGDRRYGYLRSPWNVNPSPYITRFADRGARLPDCEVVLLLCDHSLEHSLARATTTDLAGAAEAPLFRSLLFSLSGPSLKKRVTTALPPATDGTLARRLRVALALRVPRPQAGQRRGVLPGDVAVTRGGDVAM